MAHISGPLHVIYDELRERIMCYHKSDQLLKAAEDKYMNWWKEHRGYSDERAFAKLDEWYVMTAAEQPDRCCHDIIVDLQDTNERLECTSREL
jgi:hypothetical protein